MSSSLHLDVHDASHVAHARRAVLALAAEAGLGEDRQSDLAIIITELATNILKHAQKGSVIAQVDVRGGIELLSCDVGPGMANLQKCLADGYSTAGSAGTGLGAVSRLSTEFDAYSAAGKGTLIYARVANASSPTPPPGDEFGYCGICVPIRGETACGDAFCVVQRASWCSVILADGLGHGPVAAEASQAATSIFSASSAGNPTDLVQSIHQGLRSTRGAAIAVARIDSDRNVVEFCGLGNIVGAILMPDGVRRMVSHNGTAGQGTPRIGSFTYPWAAGASLIMHSDGIQTRWDLGLYPGLQARNTALMAGVLFRDFARGRDDATALVLRRGRA